MKKALLLPCPHGRGPHVPVDKSLFSTGHGHLSTYFSHGIRSVVQESPPPVKKLTGGTAARSLAGNTKVFSLRLLIILILDLLF